MAGSASRGSAANALKPAARTLPRTELSASLLTTSGGGMPRRETVITSSSKVGGSTIRARRLTKRSKTRASAITEHTMRGQMGQPAACMMEIKGLPV